MIYSNDEDSTHGGMPREGAAGVSSREGRGECLLRARTLKTKVSRGARVFPLQSAGEPPHSTAGIQVVPRFFVALSRDYAQGDFH